MEGFSHYSVSDVLTDHIDKYISQYGKLTIKQAKVVSHITRCKTALQGGHAFSCTTCGDTVVSYNSCRDRHCPRCQGLARASWVNNRIEELLPVGYFHVVFTIPQEINPFALRNKKIVYDILFQSVSETLVTLGKDPKWLGGMIGAIAVLHTWGQNLLDHPHVHCIIPGGGIRNDDRKWVCFRDNYLIPGSVLSALFKGKFLNYFKEAIKEQNIKLYGALGKYEDPKELKVLMNTLWSKDWVVYAKKPFASPECVVKYLGRYTHRIAISNQRIVKVNDETVAFKWKDYADNDKQKIMQLTPEEFIRRFFLHVLPDRYTRIRYIGFLGNANKNKKLKRCFELLQMRYEKKKKLSNNVVSLYLELFKIDITKCKQCENGHYTMVQRFERSRYGPRYFTDVQMEVDRYASA